MYQKQKLIEKQLPLNLPTPSAHPTGNALIIDERRPATLPLNRELTVRRCIGSYTNTDRKLWAVLVALAWDDLAIVRTHETSLHEVGRLFRELKSGRNGIDWLMSSAKRLQRSNLEWEDDNEKGIVPLLGGVKITKADGRIYYQFDDFLLEHLLENKHFSRLRLHFMIGLNSKYGVSLYMLLEGIANQKEPTLDMSIDELRAALSVPEGKLVTWAHLKQKAIDPAQKEINGNELGAGFSFEYEPILQGRKVARVRFSISKTSLRDDEEKRIKARQKLKAGGQDLPEWVIQKARAAVQDKSLPLPDMVMVESEFWAYKKKKEEDGTIIKDVAAAFVGFSITKAKQILR